MRVVDYIVIIAFVALLAQLCTALEERDDALSLVDKFSGMYNGVLIGRGCRLPE